MRKILSLAVASAFIAGTAQADIILIDNFDTPSSAPVTLVDQSAGNGITFQPVSTALPSPNLANTRTIGVESIVDNNGGTGGITANVGGPLGRLNFSVFTGDNGNGYVVWSIPAFTLIPPASYFFSIVASAVGSIGGSSVPNVAQFSFNGGNDINPTNDFVTTPANIGAFGFAVPGTPLNFNLDAGEATKLSGGGQLTLKLSGGQGWNLQLDQFAIEVPEPTSLALVGLALVGAGVVSRRRKA